MVTPEVIPEVPVEVTQGSIDNFVLRGAIDDFARSIQRPVDEAQRAHKSTGGVSADSHGELSLDDVALSDSHAPGAPMLNRNGSSAPPPYPGQIAYGAVQL